jgi:hypothetical protein
LAYRPPGPRESHLEELAGHVGDDEVTPPELGEEHQADRRATSGILNRQWGTNWPL